MSEWKPKGQLSYEEVSKLLEQVDILTQIKQMDMSTIEEELAESATPIEEYMRILREGKDTQRALKQKTAKPKKKKRHWRTEKKYQKNYHLMVRKGRRIERKMEAIQKDGWWAVLNHSWKNKGLEVRITKEEWSTRIEPLLSESNIPSVWRYDTSGPISWDNVWVRDRLTRESIWDGKEELMIASGDMLR